MHQPWSYHPIRTTFGLQNRKSLNILFWKATLSTFSSSAISSSTNILLRVRETYYYSLIVKWVSVGRVIIVTTLFVTSTIHLRHLHNTIVHNLESRITTRYKDVFLAFKILFKLSYLVSTDLILYTNKITVLPICILSRVKFSLCDMTIIIITM